MTVHRPEHPNRIPAPVLKRTCSVRRTFDEDREYHIEAHRSFRELAQLIGFVQYVAAAETEEAHKLSPNGVNRAQRFALKRHASRALDQLQALSGTTDALDVQMFADTFIAELAAVAADYTGWSEERVRREAPGYS